ncbi:MAG: sugar phosphate isomerase/epimerase [Erysipelotrichaceae bacterium]|nr:sugar phosphate isomerase/epimerase [Erysipelotrichaceae bacterium]
MQELAVTISYDNKNDSVYDTIDAIKKAGFRKVFLQWYDKDWEVSQQQQCNYARQQGLEIIFAHLGYQSINDLWLEGETGDGFIERFCRDIDDCAANGIPMVMMHLCSKSVAPEPNEIGLERLRKIVAHAVEKNIKIAFENTKIPGYQEYVLSRIPEAGNCYDAGHCHAHFNDEYDFAQFKDRFYCVHLHDNHGESDEHLLPGDGTIDWPKVMAELKHNGYAGPITLEIVYHGPYTDMTLDEFYQEGFRRGQWLQKLYEEA